MRREDVPHTNDDWYFLPDDHFTTEMWGVPATEQSLYELISWRQLWPECWETSRLFEFTWNREVIETIRLANVIWTEIIFKLLVLMMAFATVGSLQYENMYIMDERHVEKIHFDD